MCPFPAGHCCGQMLPVFVVCRLETTPCKGVSEAHGSFRPYPLTSLNTNSVLRGVSIAVFELLRPLREVSRHSVNALSSSGGWGEGRELNTAPRIRPKERVRDHVHRLISAGRVRNFVRYTHHPSLSAARLSDLAMSTDVEQDVLEQNEPVIVDCDVLEAAKENIQPLAKGRRVTTLAGILATPHIQRESRLAATRNRLRMNVQLALENPTPDEDEDEDEMEDADPLDAYCQYVYWVVENYPQGHSVESGLLELLEEATRVLKDHQGGKWRGDLRYLKLWVLYASYVEKPAVIFKFCMVNEIGASHSLLYEEFAIALERAGR